MMEPTYRVDRRMVLADWPAILVIVLQVLFSLWALPRLPERVPVHWGITGQPNRWGSPFEAAFVTTGVTVAIYLLMLYLPVIDPRRRNYALFPEAYRVIRWAVVFLLSGVHLASLTSALGAPVKIAQIALLAVSALFVVMGNLMGRVRPNYFVGIRTPWTLASEEVWTRTHRFGGRLWVGGGLLAVIAAFLPAPWGRVVLLVILAVMAIGPVLYSYLQFKARNKE